MSRKNKITQVHPAFNLSRALVVRSRMKAGISLRKIARFYDVTDTALYLANKHLQKYIDAGLVKEPEANHD